MPPRFGFGNRQKTESAVAKETALLARLTFSGSTLLSSTTGNPRFFLHRAALSVKFEADAGMEVYAAGLGDLEKNLELDISWPRFRFATSRRSHNLVISSSINPPSPFARFARSFATRARSAFHRRNSTGARPKTKTHRWVSNTTANVRSFSFNRWEEAHSVVHTWRGGFRAGTPSAHFLRVGALEIISQSTCRDRIFRNYRRITADSPAPFSPPRPISVSQIGRLGRGRSRVGRDPPRVRTVLTL